MPLGGRVADYKFDGAQGTVYLSELFGEHETLIVYSYMFDETSAPCPMCSAFLDSIKGQLPHVNRRAAFAVVARSSMPRIAQLVKSRGWQDLPWVSSANNTYSVDYLSEMPDGSQAPVCNVFVRRKEGIYHFWHCEAFFASDQTHPRHLDMIWPLWHILDLTPQGRGDFMPLLTDD